MKVLLFDKAKSEVIIPFLGFPTGATKFIVSVPTNIFTEGDTTSALPLIAVVVSNTD